MGRLRECGEPNRTKVLGFIQWYIGENGFPPSYAEIMDATGLSSTSVVSHVVNALAKSGKIVVSKGKRRTIRVVPQ